MSAAHPFPIPTPGLPPARHARRADAFTPRPPRCAAGFTLIEVMVVLVIMGLMATGLSVGLDSLRGREADQALRRLRLVLEASADRAAVRGRPLAIEFLPDGYRFAALDADDTWRPLIDPPVFTERTLPEGLSWSGLRLDGQDAPQPRLQFGTQTPEYELRVATPRGIALLTGKANGDVLLTPPDAPPRS